MAKKKKKRIKEGTKEAKPGEKSQKEVIKRENKQLFWIILIIFLIFLTFFIINQIRVNRNYFEYGGANWTIEDYGNLRIYHGRFEVFTGKPVIYDIYLRNDPRTNKVLVTGGYGDFKEHTYFSFSKGVNQCRGDIPRVVSDLSNFLEKAIGVDNVSPATNSRDYTNESTLEFVNCTSTDRGVVIFEMGEEQSVMQSDENKFCHIITIKDCKDLATVEKYMTSIVSFNNQLLDIKASKKNN